MSSSNFFRTTRETIKHTELTWYLKLIGSFFGSNLLVVVTQAVSGLLIARWAGPENMGYLNTMALSISYIPIFFLGINNGLNRELPYLIGQGRTENVQTIANTAWWWMRNISLFVGILFAAGGVVIWLRGSPHLGQACLAYSVISALWVLSHYIEITYRTSSDFIELSKVKTVNAVLAVVTTPFVLLSPWWGLLARATVLQGTYNLLLHRKRRIVPVAVLDRGAWLRLLKIGLPLFTVGFLFSFFNALDRTLIVRFLEPKDMGLYTPAIMIASALSVLPSSISQIIYPRMCLLYGRTGSPRSLARLAFVPMLVLSMVLVPVFAFGWWFVDPFVRLVLPKYVAGIHAGRWIIVAMYFWSLSSALNVFPAINKLWPYACAICLGILTSVLVAIRLLGQGLGLSAVAIGQACGMAMLLAVSTAFAIYYVFETRELRRKQEPTQFPDLPV